MIDEIQQDADTRMGKSIETLKNALRKLRTGRAHTSLLDHITVDYYGTETALNQVATVSVADARMLTVNSLGKKTWCRPWKRPL